MYWYETLGIWEDMHLHYKRRRWRCDFEIGLEATLLGMGYGIDFQNTTDFTRTQTSVNQSS